MITAVARTEAEKEEATQRPRPRLPFVSIVSSLDEAEKMWKKTTFESPKTERNSIFVLPARPKTISTLIPCVFVVLHHRHRSARLHNADLEEKFSFEMHEGLRGKAEGIQGGFARL
jgi:hypothetical protein